MKNKSTNNNIILKAMQKIHFDSFLKTGQHVLLTLGFLLGIVFFSNTANAAVSQYAFSSGVGTYTPISVGGGATLHSSGAAMDDASFLVTLPFTFTLDGVAYTQVSVAENGFVGFGATLPTTSERAVITSTFGNRAVAAFSGDLGGRDAASNMMSQVIGVAPFRTFVAQWTQIQNFSGGLAQNYTFQIQLEEAGGVALNQTLKCVYNSMTNTGSTAMQVGLKGLVGPAVDFNNRTTATDWSNTIAGTINSASVTLSSSVFPVANLTYTWTPPPPCVNPSAQPTLLSLNPLVATQINGTFTAAPGSDSYLVVRYPAGTGVITPPVNGTSYTAGSALGLGTIAAVSLTNSFSAAGLITNTSYDFYIYSMNSVCTGGPLYLTTSPLFGTATTPGNLPPTCNTTYAPLNTAANVPVTQVLSWSGALASPAITGYDVYFSTNQALVNAEDPSVRVTTNQVGTTFTPIVGTVTYGTTYYWKVNPRNTFGITSCATQSYTTYVPVGKMATIGGLWSSGATWGGTAPVAGDNVTIPSGVIVTVDQAVTGIGNLNIDGTLQWNATSNAMTLFGNINVSATGRFLPYTTSLVGVTINIGGNLNNDGFINAAVATTTFNFNGSQQAGGNSNPTLSGSGSYVADGLGRYIIRQLAFQTNGNSTVSATIPQQIVTGSFIHTAGTLNTNGKVAIDNTLQVYGQALNLQVASVAVTGMGVAYTNAPTVFGATIAPWTVSGAAVANSRYNVGTNVYLCTTGGTFDVIAPVNTTPVSETNGTATLLWLGTTGTLGNPFQVTATTLGTQYFCGGNLYVCTVAGTPLVSAPPVHLSGTAVSGTATFLYIGSPAQVTVNYDATTQTVRSLNLINAGSGYSSAPAITFNLNGGTVTTAASASVVFMQSIVGPANSLTQKSGSATITGGLTINSTAGALLQTGVGNISTANGGVNYTVAPTVGFAGPPGLNLITNPGSGYLVQPTITVTGGTLVSGTALTTANFTITVNQGIVESVYLNTATTATYSVPPTLALTASPGVTATLAFPAGCWPAATAVIGSNGQITNFLMTNSGYGYPNSVPIVGVGTVSGTATGGTFSTVASAPTARLAVYNLTLNNFTPSPAPAVNVEGAEMPASRRIGTLSVSSLGANITGGNIQLYNTAPLTLSAGSLNLGGSNLLATWNGYAGQTGSLTQHVTNGSFTVTLRGGSTGTVNFPFDATVGWVSGTTPTAVTTGSTVTQVTVSKLGAPSGAVSPSGTPIGTRAWRVQVGAGMVYGVNPVITINWNANDALVSDQAGLFVAQGTTVAGPWTTISTSSGIANAPLAATGSRLTATVAPGPFVPTGDDVLAWVTTFVNSPLTYNIARTTGAAYSTIMGTGTSVGYVSANTDDQTSPAITIPSSTFTYQGQVVTGFNVCLNGWVKMITATSPSTTLTNSGNLFGAGAIPMVVAPFWDNLQTNPSLNTAAEANNHVKYLISADPIGSRTITIEWSNMTVNAGSTGPLLNFQVVLNEVGNTITFNYGTMQAYNGTINHRYSYSVGLGGQVVSGFPLAGQVLAQQYENSDVFSNQFVNITNAGANGLMIAPECNSRIVFTPGAGYLGGTIPPSTPPVNDDPAGAITLASLPAVPANLCGQFYSSRNATATTSPSVCAGNNDDDVWFKFVCIDPNTTVRMFGSGGYIPRIQVLNFPSLTPLATPKCVVGTGGIAGTGAGTTVDASLAGLVTAGQTYYIRVYHNDGGTQALASAFITPLGVVNNLIVTNTLANGSQNNGYNAASSGDFTTARVRITGGGGTDAIGTANLSGNVVTTLSLQSGGYGYTSTPTVEIEKPAAAQSGEFALVVFAVAPNDECVNAIQLNNINTGNCVTGQNSLLAIPTASASASAEPVTCGGIADDDVWYKFDAIHLTSTVNVKGNGSYNPVVQIYDAGVSPGACVGKTSILCLNATGAGGTENATFATVIGHTYLVRVYHSLIGASGFDNFDICVTSPIPACPAMFYPSNGATSQVLPLSLQWAPSAFATGYDVYVNTFSPPTTLVSSNQAGTFYTPNLTTNTTYFWRVEARNANGVSATCGDSTFTTGPDVLQTISGPVTSCTGNFYDSGGSSAGYGDGENSTVTIFPATPLMATKLTFSSFATELGADFLTVYDGPNATYPILYGPISGTVAIPNLIGSDVTGALTVKFTSNASVTGAGWVAAISCVAPCAPISASASLSICGGDPTTLTVSSSNNAYAYTWTPSAFLNQTTGASVIATPLVTVTYTVTGVDGECFPSKNITVTVNNKPVVNPTSTVVNLGCDSSSVQLNANGVSGNTVVSNVNAQIGTGVVLNTTGSEPAPYGQNWGGQRHQMLILASELTAAGLSAGPITSLQFDLSSISTQPLQNFEIQIGNTALTGLSANSFQPTPFSVYGPLTYNPAVGINTHTFSTPFNWDGASNIIVQVCFFNPAPTCPTTSFTSNCVFKQTTTPFVSTIHFRADGSCSQCSSTTTTAVFSQRPNMILAGLGITSTPISVSWSPATGLSSSTIQNPIAKVIGTATYTATVTDLTSGCTKTSSITLSVNAGPSSPSCSNATVCGQGTASLTATGSGGNLFWTENAAGGNIVATGGAYSPFVTASHSFGVHETGSLSTLSVGYDPSNIPTQTSGAGFFPTSNQGMWFKVNDFNGMILNSVDIYTNTPVGAPYTFSVEDSLGNILGTVSGVTSTTNPYFFPGPFGPPFYKHTVSFGTAAAGMFIPYNTIPYRIRPTINPNMLVHQNATVAAGAPYQIAGVMQIMGYGNITPASYFGTNTFGFFYNWQVQTGCISAACVSPVTVTSPPALVIVPSGPTAFCGAGTVSLNASVNSDPSYVNFSWAPATGLSATTGASVTASPSATTTYTVTASDGLPFGCTDTQTVTITFNPAPFVAVASAPYDTLCLGTNFVINASAGTATIKQIGFTENPSQVSGAVFNGANLAQREQMLFTAAELNAAGITGPTSITSLAFDVSNKLSTAPYTGFTVSLANQTAPLGSFTAGLVNYQTTGFTTCYTGNYTTTGGWNTISFTTPFAWDGVSNIIVNTCFTNAVSAGNFFDQVYTSSTGLVNTFKNDNADACGDVSGTTSNLRPNVRFAGGAVNYSWTPALSLSSATVSNPTFISSANGAYTYTVTVTDPATSCTATGSISFVVSQTPKTPQVAFIGDSVFCFTGIASMRAAGTTGTFVWQSSTDGINWTNKTCTANDLVLPCDTFTGGVINITTYYRVAVSCGGDSSFSRILTAEVNDPAIASIITDTVCGEGQVCMQAFANKPGYEVNWYAAAAGGTPLATNTTQYCANITGTTTYYAQAVAGGSVLAPGSLTTPMLGGNGSSGNAFNIVATNTVTLHFLSINTTGGPTEIYYIPGGFAGPTLNSSVGWILAGSAVAPSGVPAVIPVDINLTIPGGQTYGIAIAVSGSVTYTNGTAFGNTLVSDANISIKEGCGGAGFGGAFAFGNSPRNLNGTVAYDVSIGCGSPVRVPVVGVSNPAPPMAVIPQSASTCEGSPVTMTIDSAGLANYQLFSWSPANGLDITTGATVIATPVTTTSYTVIATDTVSGFACQKTDTVTITVTPRPSINSLTATPNPVCEGDSAQITLNATPFIVPSAAYVLSSVAFAPVTPTGTVTTLVSAGTAVTPQSIVSLDDGTWDNLALPSGFAFNYFGTTPTTFSVSTNGFMTFGPSGGAFCCSGQIIPNAASPNSYLAFAHEDWQLGTSGDIDYFTNGVAPFRKFVLRFTNCPRFSGISGTSTGEIILNETFNTVEYQVNSVTTAIGDFTTMGIEDPAGTLATVVSGRNSTDNWTATNEGWKFAVPTSTSLTYSWSPSAGLSSTSVSNPKAAPSVATVYTVTVFESATGCSRSSSVAINTAAKLKPYLYTINAISGDTTILGADSVVCSNNLGFNIYVGDSGAYAGGYPAGTTFHFTCCTAPNNTLDSLFVDHSDNYNVIVTLASGLGGCSAATPSYFIDFGSVTAPQVAITSDSVGCFGASTGNLYGAITFGGSPDFRWQWYDSSNNLLRDTVTSAPYDTLTGLPVGNYSLLVTDHIGVAQPPYCQESAYIYIGEPNGPIEVFEEVNGHVDVQCYGYASGQIDITASGGTGALSYLWSNGSTDEDQTGLVAGIYTVTVSDTRGCTYEFATEIIENPQVTIGTDQSNVSCNNGFDGSAVVYVNGGVPGYSYLWSDGQTDQTAFDLAAGTYTVIITDNSGNPGCDTIVTFLITEPTLLDATSTVNNLNCHGASNGVATVYPIGGNPPYNYSWNSIPAQTTATAVNLTAGTYTCVITDFTGCIKDVVVQITAPDSISVYQTIDNPSCNGSNDGSATVSVSGGTAGYTYLWSNGETTSTASGLSDGTYILTVTDANGCQVISTVLIVAPSPITTSITCLTNVACNGQSTGNACITPSGGTPGYSYLWNTVPAQTTSSATGLPAGTYTVIITDASGCTTTAEVTITQPDAIALNADVTDPLCNGGTGSVELSLTGGATPYSVIWSNGATTEINGGLQAGSYTVTVTDANGCILSQTFVITNPTAIVASSAVTNVSCNGGVNGSITVNVTGGAGAYTYQWSNGEVTSTIIGLVAGNYTVTITDLNSCSITQTVVVNQPAELSCICNSNVNNVSCFGAANGSITALPTGGTAPYSYSWIRIAPFVSGVLANTQTISGLTAGTYQVTITDANGCVKVGNATVTEPTQLVAFGIVNGNTCSGSSNGSITVNVYGGLPPYAYAWSTFPVQTTATATGLGAGSYTCIVTDANGCSTAVTNTISTPNAIVLVTSKTNTKCYGAKNGTVSVTASGGVAPFTYLWSNGKTTSMVIGLAAGTYTATVTDSYGCTAVASVVVGQPAKLASLYVTSNPTCFGSANGSINLTITGGTVPYTYAWSNGSTMEDQTNLVAGVYSVIVKDKNGCVISAIVTLVQPNAIALSTTVKNLTCFGSAKGKVTVNVSGGTAPYTYSWSSGSTNVSAINLNAGTYTVTVTDSKGCTASIVSTITQPAQLVCNATTINNVSCFGGTDGKINVSVSGGKAPYTYLWNTNPIGTSKIVNNVAAGTYTVIVSDKNGCTSVCTVIVTQPSSAVTATVSGSNVSCSGGNNGTASVVANGGTSPYTYLWNTGVASTSDNVSGLTAGTYTVTVTDSKGCSGSGSITITQNATLALTETHTNASCNTNNLGSITAVATGGLSPYTYTLNPGNVSNANGNFTGLTAAIYSVTVTDEAGCSATIAGIVISQPVPLAMGSTSGTDVTCYGGNNGTATAGVISGGVAPYTYNWNTVPPQVTAMAIGLTAGSYIVTVTDAGGCTISGTVVINEPQSPLLISINNQSNISCNGGTTGTAEASAVGGVAPYSYLWSDGQTTALAIGLTAGTYQVTATDANGCVATTSVVISQPNQFIVSAVFTNVLCNGNSDGTITASVSGGNAPFNYSLNPGALSSGTGLFTGLGAGVYIVRATDAGGCTSSVTITITEPSALIANTTTTNVSCNLGSNGYAAVYPAGGTTPYSYAWTGGSTAQNAAGLTAGTYTVTVTDANGCTVVRTVTISEPAALVINQSQTNVLCNGLNNGTATATVTGGSAPYFYSWSNGQLTATATGLTSNLYTVIVTDYNGCTLSSLYNITETTSLLVDTDVTNPACFGGLGTAELIVVGGNPGYTYLWSNGATTSIVTLPAGTYYVTVTDASGCSITQCVVVVEPAQLLCATNANNVTCNGANNGAATVTAIGGTAPYQYSWNTLPAQLTATATGLAPGNYSVIVTDVNGCSSLCSVTVTEPALLNLGLSTSNASCGTSNGSAAATVAGGTPPYSYLWSTTETSQSIANLAPGTYTVTVTDANGCGPVSASVTIGTNVPVSCTTTQVNPTCSGYSNGTATVTPAGGNGSFTALWNTAPAQTTLTATGLAAGTYEVTVTDISGCSSVCMVEIVDPAPLVLSSSQTNNACNGGVSGVAIVTANGGTPYTVGAAYTYLWTNGQTTATATGLVSGTYYVTVMDSIGCSGTLCVIMQQPVSMTCNTSSTPTVCGQSIGSAIVNVYGGEAPYSYNWSTVPTQTNAIATLLSAGTYTVVVTDANGCTSQCTATVIQPGAVSFSLAVVNASCNGGNGSVSVSGLNGGSAPYSYLWSNGNTTSSISAIAGSYTVTVTDANGCSMFAVGTVNQPAVLVLAASRVNVTCNGNTNGSACVTASGGTQPYSYSWNTGASSVCINSLVAGTYTVTATDSKGCTTSIAIIITQPDVLDTLSTSATVASCGLSNGTGTINPVGGTTPYTYAWNTSPVQTTQTATGLTGGNNFVSVTDANGCAITVCVKVPTSNGIGLSLNSPSYAGGVNIRCNGGNDGSINLTVSGTGPFTYLWSNGATTEDVFGLTAGTYSVIVSNGGCTSIAGITLTQSSVISTSTTQVNVTCKGGITGSATVNVTGGSAPYTYSWSTIPVQTGKTATGLAAGTYTVIVGDANGCTQTASVTLTQPATGMNITASSVNPNCNGASNGSIDITVTGGTMPYSYLWTDGAIIEDRTGMNAGSHTVTVTDASGCTIQLCVVLTQPTQVALTTSKTDVSCAGGNSGSANVVAAGGTPPYTYLWNSGATTAAISNLYAGTYTVTVTDFNGCVRFGNVVINASTPMSLTTSSTNVTVYGGNNGTASVTVLSGGVAPYSYSWNTIPVKTTAAVSGLTAGTYQVTVVDNKGCVKTATVVITQPNYICNTGTPFRTETPSRWGASSGTAATYLTANFSAAFPGGLVVGGGCIGGKTLSVTNATAVRNYEVNQSVSGSGTVLSANLVNPASAAFQSALAANCVALTLNVTFDAYDPNFAPLPTVTLGNLIYNVAPFSGYTVNQILSLANTKLGGCSSSFTTSQFNTAIQNIDSAYKAGVTGPTASMLSCPAPTRIANATSVSTDNDVTVYPNPSDGVLNVKFDAQQEGKVVMNLIDLTGRIIWNTEEAIFVGENIRTYEFGQITKGIYMMQVIKEGKTSVIKVIIR